MLRSLRIERLLLVDSALVPFGEGLNILTGESGSGKSAVLHALKLLLGERADPGLIRQGASSAVIEAVLDMPHAEEIATVRRELYPSGKSRAFLNDRLVNAAVLKQLLSASFEIVDQQSSELLKTPARQREFLDLWAGVDGKKLAAAQAAATTSRLEWEKAKREAEAADKEAVRWEQELAELEEAAFQEGEEELLAREHERLSSAEEKTAVLSALYEQIAEGERPLAAMLGRLHQALGSYADCREAADLLKTASLEVKEAGRLVAQALDAAQPDPRRLEQVEIRIGLLERLKRRYGCLKEAKEFRREKLSQFNGLENALGEKARQEEQAFQALFREAAAKRKAAAPAMEERLVATLRTLNLPHARVAINVSDKGDEIRFFFNANPGQDMAPLEECASGGEKSRLLFALKLLIAEKENRSCLIFDEIDSNVGGHTASVLGELLRDLSQTRQVICITHFIQVARSASRHLLVEKSSDGAETRTSIRLLDAKEREEEYARMIGLKKIEHALR